MQRDRADRQERARPLEHTDVPTRELGHAHDVDARRRGADHDESSLQLGAAFRPRRPAHLLPSVSRLTRTLA